MGKRKLTEPAPSGPTDTLHGKAVEGVTDLHGLDARAAEIRLESLLTRWAATRPGSDVRYLWLAIASSVGAAVVLSRARATLGGAAPE